ncbi:unnamed protein product [Linum tenue]|uniref:Succinate-semialdehyde dehydrogenase, mitochondrial n=1 Tax=Linum tenue TaxID=586396 RepID=A0AAV0M2U5_9ROSI|nr:unnamed protein product [Linum tenue]
MRVAVAVGVSTPPVATMRSSCTRRIVAVSYRFVSMHMAAAPLSRTLSTESVAARLTSAGLLRTKGLIGANWTDARDGKTMPVYNPSTGEVIADVPFMGSKDTEDAISSAYDAFPVCSYLTIPASSLLILRYDLLMANKEEIGQLITLEQGKPLKEAIGEVNYGASFIEYFAEEAKRIYGDIIPPTLNDRRILVLKQPIGVIAAITPWNFPLAMITRKVGPALACGCTAVIKPSELTPFTALAAVELALQAGIPPGVLNVVMGDAPAIGDALMANTRVRKITFTGSTAVGKKLMAGAAGTVKKVSLELGGNAPCIIFDDADLDVAVKGTLGSKFRNSGQTCVCANRILVQDGTARIFLWLIYWLLFLSFFNYLLLLLFCSNVVYLFFQASMINLLLLSPKPFRFCKLVMALVKVHPRYAFITCGMFRKCYESAMSVLLIFSLCSPAESC